MISGDTQKMILIAHRGNTNGPNLIFENDPGYLQMAMDNGYHVEVDVWLDKHGFMLGHDIPLFPVSQQFLLDDRVWCHAKNELALDSLLKLDAHCFWHKDDERTMTSKGWVWTNTGAPMIDHRSVQVDASLDNVLLINKLAKAICSDYVSHLRIKS